MTALPTIAPAGAKIPQILDHVADCWPDDYPRLDRYLHARVGDSWAYAHQDVADALTEYCTANNLGTGISEASVRRYRKKTR